MADFHTKTFYGQKTSVRITSPSRQVPYIFLSCINRKDNGSWEKPSEGEGKTVRLSIEEIICISEVLYRRSANWRGYHVFRERKTEIYVGWEDESRQVLLIKIGDYTKKLRFPNINFMTMMLDHILEEKIEFATSGTFETKTKEAAELDEEAEYGVFSEHITARDGLHIVETTEYSASRDTAEIDAIIKVESPKALLITLDSGEEFWVPKSTIHSNYNTSEKKKSQKFIVDKWIIEKYKILGK
ncbi:MAG: hypothetical protein JSV62_00925 [Promethearchaeota archaeon]|nr:MAG: hypothetical protein JSV62_00925 [Candidatus Lokiarchaeota archaeon]